MADLNQETVRLSVDLRYFNSSSTKMLFTLFDHFHIAAEQGKQILIDWHHDIEDDTMLEFGQELAEDFPAITLTLHAIDSQ